MSLFGLSCCLIIAGTVAVQPEQVHIALAGEEGMRITWFTADDSINPHCLYGTSPDALTDSSSAETITYLAGHGSHHTVTLKDLTRETKYFYTCGEDSSMSEVYHFNTPRNADSEEPIRLAVFGDMGYLDSVTRRMGILGSVTMSNNWSATFSRELLEDMKDNDEIDMIWHVGDVGYADDAAFHTIKTAVTFEYEGAYNGYMNWIQNLTNTLPYHVSVGNHESECHDPACVLRFKELGKPLSNFTAFNSRWHMPSPESGGVLSMWYSWNYGAVHFTNIDTSTDYPNAPEGEKGDSGIFDAGHFATDGEYLDWVERDLKAAHEDPNIKWILAGGHRPFSFDDPDYAQLETLFEKYGVAMYFAGHSHSYSRFSAEDNKGIIHITVGGAGCEEMVFADTNPTPGKHTGATCEEWSTRQVRGERKNKRSVCENAAFFTDAYAIGKLTVENNGWGDMKWELLSSIDGSLLDSILISA